MNDTITIAYITTTVFFLGFCEQLFCARHCAQHLHQSKAEWWVQLPQGQAC